MKKKDRQAIAGYSNAVNTAEYGAALDNYYTSKRNDDAIRSLKNKSSKDQWIENEKARQLRITQTTDAYDKSASTYKTTLEAIDFAARDAEERVRLGLDEQIAEFAFQYDDLERDLMKEAMQAGLQYDQQEQSLEAAVQTDRIEQENVKLQRRQKQTEFTEQLDQNARDQRQTRGESNKAMLDETIDRIRKTGASRARGQTGRSAQRAISTTQALSGVNQKQLEDSLFYSQQKIDSDRRVIERTRRTQLGSDHTKVVLDKTLSTTDTAAQFGTLGLQAKSSDLSRTRSTKAVRRQQKNIQQALGISQEEFNMSRQKLAESLSSAAGAAEIKLQNIKTKEFEAKGKAYAQKMVNPRFGTAAPKPYEVPKTDFVKPKPAPKTPIGPGTAGRSVNRGGSTASMALGIGGTALTAAGALMTGPAAPFVAGAGALLGGLSSLFN